MSWLHGDHKPAEISPSATNYWRNCMVSCAVSGFTLSSWIQALTSLCSRRAMKLVMIYLHALAVIIESKKIGPMNHQWDISYHIPLSAHKGWLPSTFEDSWMTKLCNYARWCNYSNETMSRRRRKCNREHYDNCEPSYEASTEVWYFTGVRLF